MRGSGYMFDIEEELKKLPAKPGVYIMHDASDEIIYVGKAIVLKNRVRQYFQSSRNLSTKIEQMVSHVARFEYIVTNSELEALVLECNLIKEHCPKYNTLLKDDKAYSCIKVTRSEDFPRVMAVKQKEPDNEKYYGPFTSKKAVNETVSLLQKIYKLRTCKKNLKEGVVTKDCLNYHLGICSAPCLGIISKEAYNEAVDNACRLLDGDYKYVIHELEDKMYKASDALEFEEAAKYRDHIQSIKHVVQKQRINTWADEDRDVIACSIEHTDAVVQVFFVRSGRVSGRELFRMTVYDDAKKEHVIGEFLKQFYGGTPYIPPQILIECDVEERELLEQFLTAVKGKKVSIEIPKKGIKEGLIELARENARIALEKDLDNLKIEEAATKGAVRQICELIGMDYARRVEAYDISNISGTDSVGSMIVFEDGKPKKSDYRKFKIKTVEGPNDYASLKEVLTRRFSHGLREKEGDRDLGSFSIFPDLIMMDGGKGQVHIACEVLNELGLDIPVCGMVKDDNHRTRGLYYQGEIQPLDIHSQGFRLITRMQDEAHRFAITFHRSLRSKREVKSELEDIKNIGPKKREALMRYFRDIMMIKEASVDELMNADGISKNDANRIYEYFH